MTDPKFEIKGLSFWLVVGLPWLVGVVFIVKSVIEALT